MSLKIKYHPKLLKIFTEEELNILMQECDYSVNKKSYIHILHIYRDIIHAEIFTDCEAEQEDVALILRLDDYEHDKSALLSKDEFWQIYMKSKNKELECITVQH
ncbi:hypothetical protein MLC52_05435 [Sulfurimonas sp. NW15]|uniref:hypothetical protein n=1 Tax=Sulfurimonas sp. NW15 TaxID=2922729 RepID=UPI003DA9A0B6